MHIGDRVRLLHDKEEGIIRRIIDDRLVEVEIDDGFIIPVLKKELVTIASHEKETFREEDNVSIQPEKPKVTSDKGIYLAFDPKNDNDLDLHLINNTELEIVFRIYTPGDQANNGIKAGHLGAISSSLVTSLRFSELKEWPEFHFEILFFKKGDFNSTESINRTIKFKAKIFSRDKHTAPVLDKPCFLYQLDSDNTKPDPVKLKKSFFEKDTEQYNKEDIEESSEKTSTVDLHIESLLDDHNTLNNNEILEVQIQHFESKLNEGLIKGYDSMVFIHGVGNGILRKMIHKKLSGLNEISYYEDARKDKFGYGATKVTFK